MTEQEFITSQDIQNTYIKFYSYMMQYLWDINTVMDLAKLEIAIYKRFPDKDEMIECISQIERDIKDTFNNEEYLNSDEFKKIFEHLKSDIKNYTNSGFDIWNMVPVLDTSDILDDKNSVDEDDKLKLHVGRIVKQ